MAGEAISPISFGEQRRKNILAHFGEQDNMEKALSNSEFTEKYGVGHDVFTVADISKFEAEMKAKHGEGEDVVKAISTEFGTLTSVLVKGVGEGSGLAQVFVREAKSEEPTPEAKEAGEEESVEAK